MNFIDESWIFDEYKKAFKGYVPPIFAQEQMLAFIENAEAWHKTCFDWAMNDYKPSSVGKMLDYYNQQLNGTTQYSKKPKQASQIGRHDPAIDFGTFPDCDVCENTRMRTPYAKFGEPGWNDDCPECLSSCEMAAA